MSKPLSKLLEALVAAGMDAKAKRGYQKINIENLVFDSREATKGSLFFALPGIHTDGSKFIVQAIKRGATAVVYSGELSKETAEYIDALAKNSKLYGNETSGNAAECAFIKVKDARQSMAPVADAFFDHPSSRLIVIGVTGTEGKSSTVSFIWQLLRLMGKKAGFISTVEYSTGEDAIPNPEHQTTPEAPIIQRRLYEMLQAGCEYAVLEASSHALSPRTSRLGCVLFDCGVFMNVTLEHLEFHGTFEQYRDDKANLFRALDTHNHKKLISGVSQEVPCAGIVNKDDKSAEYFTNATRHKVLSFGINKLATLMAEDIVSDAHGVYFTMVENNESGGDKKTNIKVEAPLPGAFNALNLMASSLAVCAMTKKSIKDIVPLFQKLVPITGRMTIIDGGQPFEVIIDYAHTPSSFKMVLPPIAKRCKGKVIAVFGSGGERDKVKRPLQGEVAAEYCGMIILANEDPRKEDEMQILNDIAIGAERGGKKRGENLFLIPDRVKAIRFAFEKAKALDIVLLLGKGHENSIIGKDGPVPYDEAAAALEILGILR